MTLAGNSLINIDIAEIDYNLPEGKIAVYPLESRQDSRLLKYKDKEIEDKIFRDLADYLTENSLLVFNDTKVVRARLQFKKKSGAAIEIFCLEPHAPADYERAFTVRGSSQWKCLTGNLKKWKNGLLEREINFKDRDILLKARKIEDYNQYQIIEFDWSDKNLTFSELLEISGETPIPPYLNRRADKTDYERYQTLYAKTEGSVAAPTAGLHFTGEVFKRLEEKGISMANVTLHVGAGTFRPVQNESIRDHIMHSEFFSLSIESIEKLASHKGSIIAVGTTSVRTLESLYFCGIKLLTSGIPGEGYFHVAQLEWVETNSHYSFSEALDAVMKYMKDADIRSFHASTQLMILPGYKFRFIDGIITNFHQPKSTLLLLVSAFVGEDWRKIYEHALRNNYRFLSYGDSSLLFKPII